MYNFIFKIKSIGYCPERSVGLYMFTKVSDFLIRSYEYFCLSRHVTSFILVIDKQYFAQQHKNLFCHTKIKKSQKNKSIHYMNFNNYSITSINF